MAINNPYVPGDPFSYDLKWIVQQIKTHSTILESLDEKIAAAVQEYLDFHDPVYYSTAQDLIDSAAKPGSLAYIEGYHAKGDGGANLYYITSDYNDVLAADFYLTLSGPNRWAVPIIVTPYVTPEMFGAKGDGTSDDTQSIQDMFDSGAVVYYFYKKTYLIKADVASAPLTDADDPSYGGIFINKECDIIGNGATIMTYNGLDVPEDAYAIIAQAPIHIENLKIDGQYPTFRHNYGIQLNSEASGSTIRSCTITNLGGSPIVLNGRYTYHIEDVSVEDLYCENVGNTIFCCWADQCNFSHIRTINTSEGFDFDKLCTGISIDDVLIKTYRGTGADAAIEINGGHDFTINNVVVEDFVDGLLLNGKITPHEGITTISKSIHINNFSAKDIDGYGIVCGNSVAGMIETEDVTINNINIDTCTLHCLHLRGKNIYISNAILQNSNQAAVLIDTAGKTDTISMSNVKSMNNVKGFISCSVDCKAVMLSNIYDDEGANVNTINTLTNQTLIMIQNMVVANADNLATANGRVYSLGATHVMIDGLWTQMLSNAWIAITDASIRHLSNCRMNTSANRSFQSVNVYRANAATTPPDTGTIYNYGDLIVTDDGVYYCTQSNVGGGTATFTKLN